MAITAERRSAARKSPPLWLGGVDPLSPTMPTWCPRVLLAGSPNEIPVLGFLADLWVRKLPLTSRTMLRSTVLKSYMKIIGSQIVEPPIRTHLSLNFPPHLKLHLAVCCVSIYSHVGLHIKAPEFWKLQAPLSYTMQYIPFTIYSLYHIQ